MVEQEVVAEQERTERPNVVIEMWADLGCPWCYVGKHRLRTAIEQRSDADRFEIVIRSFQLDPDAPRELEKNADSFIRSHRGASPADVVRAERQLQAIARTEGLEFTLDRMNSNTFDLHRALQYANDEGAGFAFFSTLQDGFFTGALNPYAPEVVVAVAGSVGLDGQRVREILAGNEYADRVRADRKQALDLDATGVPFVVVDRKVGAPGAQKTPVYAQLLERVAGPAPRERVA